LQPEKNEMTMSGTFYGLITDLKEKLAGPLPGLASQLKMAGMKRFIRDGKLEAPSNVRKGGVLALFYPHEGKIFIVFMKRTEYPGVHSGQISFPGGGSEAEDADIIATALREAEEEIGVMRTTVEPIGMLTDLYIPPSNFLVTPVVGYTAERPYFTADPEEVDQIIEIELSNLMDPSSRQEREISLFPAVKITVPCFYVSGHVIWGATAMMLSELIELISPGS
jgi:8-oxo-dGTP pyrophosphatase MutT (NUDIX family)